jgi:hypothetical protein
MPDAAVRAAQDETIDPVVPAERDLLSDHPAQRHAEHVGALDPEVVEEGDRVVGQRSRGVGTRRDGGATATAVVEGDDPPRFAKPLCERRPVAGDGRDAGDEQHGPAGAALLVVQLESVELRGWHAGDASPRAAAPRRRSRRR